MSKPAGARKVTVIGRNQPATESDDGERSASPISQFSPTPPPPEKPSPLASVRSTRSTAAKTTRSLVNTLKGAAKAATYAIGQGKPGSSKAAKARDMDTSSVGERDITPTQHHSSKAGDAYASTLSQEEAIFESIAGWTPPNNDHLIYWDPLSGATSNVDPDTFLGCKFKAAAYTRRYDIRGWILYRTLEYPNTQVFIYLPADIPLNQMQMSYFLSCCGLQIFPDDIRDYTVPTCILKYLTNVGSDSNPHWILAGDTNPFIPVHRVGARDDDADGIEYTSPEQTPNPQPVVKHEDRSDDSSRYGEAVKEWTTSPAETYRTPSMGLMEAAKMAGVTTGHEGRSMSPHRYLSPTPASSIPPPPPNQLAAFPQITIPFQDPVIPQGSTRGSVKGQPDQVDALGNRYSFGLSQTPQVPDKNWHAFARDEDRNVALKGINVTDMLRDGVKGKKHIPTPYGQGDNLFLRSWDDVKVVSRKEYLEAGGKNGQFMSRSYGSNVLPDVPQAAFVEKGDTEAWAAWAIEAMRNINFINDFGRYDAIAKEEATPSQFEKISVFSNEQRRDMICMLIQLITSMPTDPTTEQDWLRSINRSMPWMFKDEADDLAMRTVQIEAAIRSTDRACDYIQKDYMAQFYAKYGYANTWKKDPLQPSVPQVWASMMKGQKLKDIDVSGKPEPHQVVQRMVAQYFPQQKATKTNAPAKPSYSVRETSLVMDSYDRVMHATAHLPRKFQVEIVNTMAAGTASNPIEVDAPPIKTRPTPRSNKFNNPPSGLIIPAPVDPNTTLTLPPPASAKNPKATNGPNGKEKPSLPTKPSYAATASRGASTPPNPKPRTWASIPQKSEKVPKKDDRTSFHDHNVVKTMAPGTLVLRIVTKDEKQVEAIKTLIDSKRDAILATDPEATIVDEGESFLVVKISTSALADEITAKFNQLAGEYCNSIGKDPKYANIFAATTKIQNTAYITTATNKTDRNGNVYTGRQLLKTLKLNRCLSDKIFVGLPAFVGRGEFTSMLTFNIVEFGGDRNSLEGSRVLIHDGMSTVMKRKFKTKALFCTKCSRWGHAVWSPCHATVISCNICAGLHPANRHSPAYDNVPVKCLNCNGPHTADSHECPCFINRHDVWELRNILEKAAADRKAATKASKADKGKERAKDDMEVDASREGFDIAPADELDGWSKAGPAGKRRKGRGSKKTDA
ncbi:hypothetical protein AX16_007405 [Volvariella volvacea WC 439]|nr:hypothetical protein AX16_007405 [Volvariella volvacea WC 439]